jgi:putative endonuclease
MMSSLWYVYVATCIDKSLYCGMTTDVTRRLYEHNYTKKAAKYTRSRRPISLTYSSSPLTRSKAASVEAKFKKLTRKQKIALVGSDEYFNTHFNINNSTIAD